MKGYILIILGVFVPFALMMLVWQYLQAAPPPAQQPNAPPAAEEPAGRSGGDPASLERFQAPRPEPVVRSGEQRGWPETLEGWTERLQQALAQRPDSAQQAAAALLLRQNRFEAAADAFDRLLVRDADNPVLLTGKAMALAGLDRHDDALPLFSSAAELEPDNPTAHFNLAVGLMRADERQQAARAFARVIRLQPGHVKALFNLAVLYQAAGRASDALEIWRRLTDGDPTSQPAGAPPDESSRTLASKLSPSMLADAWSHRGELALRLGDPLEAEMCFLNVVRLEPRTAAAWCNVGIARAEQVRRSDALTALRIALQLDPNLVPALNQAAYLQADNFRDLGHAEYGQAVVEYCRRSLQINPHQPNMAELLRAARSFDRD